MKKLILITAIVALSAFAFQVTFAQTNATQTLNLAVNSVYKISVSGASVSLTITDGTAGIDGLASVSDNSTTYSMTQNFSTPAKITAGMSPILAAGYSLKITLASLKGTSVPAVDISNGSANDVVTGIARGADITQGITYRFSADASAGMLESIARTVTLTLTN